jgi:hypothetical protein
MYMLSYSKIPSVGGRNASGLRYVDRYQTVSAIGVRRFGQREIVINQIKEFMFTCRQKQADRID